MAMNRGTAAFGTLAVALCLGLSTQADAFPPRVAAVFEEEAAVLAGDPALAGLAPRETLISGLEALRRGVLSPEDMAVLLQPEAWGRAKTGGPYRVDDDPEPAEAPRAYDVLSATASIGGASLELSCEYRAEPGEGTVTQFLVDSEGGETPDYELLVYRSAGTLRGIVRNRASGEEEELPRAAFGLSGGTARATLALGSGNLKPFIAVYASGIASVRDYDQCPKLSFPSFKANCALYLCALLSAGGPGGDPIAAAIALANQWLFALGDPEVRTMVVADARAWLGLYSEIVARQDRRGLPYSLASCPLVPKIQWADRAGYIRYEILRQMERRGKAFLDRDLYLEFVDRPESLREAIAIVEADARPFRSLCASAERIEAFIYAHRAYRSSMENLESFMAYGAFTPAQLAEARAEYKAGLYYSDHLGEKRRWDDWRWLNRQLAFLRAGGAFRGDCGDATVAMMGLYRAAGICPSSFQWIDEGENAALTHNFPAYYDPSIGRWRSVQSPDFAALPLLQAIVGRQWLHFQEPLWRPWAPGGRQVLVEAGKSHTILDPEYPGELAPNASLKALLAMGIDSRRFDAIFLSDRTVGKGLFFDESSAPSSLPDSDGDGLPDPLEPALGTLPALADSDGDGLGDGLEIELAYDPRSSASPGPSRPGLLPPVFEPEPAWDSSGVSLDSATLAVPPSTRSPCALGLSFPAGAEIVASLVEARGDWKPLPGQAALLSRPGGGDVLVAPLSPGSYLLRLFMRRGEAWDYLGRFRLYALAALDWGVPAGTALVEPLPVLAPDFGRLGLEWKAPFAGRLAVPSPTDIELRLAAPEGVDVTCELRDASDRPLPFHSMAVRAEGGWTISARPPGKGEYSLHVYAGGDGGWLYVSTVAVVCANEGPAPTPLLGPRIEAPYPWLSPGFSRTGFALTDPDFGPSRTEGDEVVVRLRAPAGAAFWQNAFDASGSRLSGDSYWRREGGLVTIHARPSARGVVSIGFGTTAPGGAAILCGRFEVRSTGLPATLTGRGALKAYPILAEDFFARGLALLPETVGALRDSGGRFSFALSIPESLEALASAVVLPGEGTAEGASVRREGARALVSFLAPEKGSYRVHLFVREAGGDWVWAASFDAEY